MKTVCRDRSRLSSVTRKEVIRDRPAKDCVDARGIALSVGNDTIDNKRYRLPIPKVRGSNPLGRANPLKCNHFITTSGERSGWTSACTHACP